MSVSTEEVKGLNYSQVIESRLKYGENIMTPTHKESLLTKFLKKFTDPLIIILLVAGLLSIGIAFYEHLYLREDSGVFFEPAGIFIAIFLATGLAFYFENKADKEFALLNQVNDDEPVEVIRDEKVTSVPRREVVVGDMVILNTGDEVPADGRLISATSLSIDESSLTGEPICHKTVIYSEFDGDATFPSNMAMKGTKVMEGHGIMTVTAVGDSTENGKVFKSSLIDNTVKTPLNEQLDSLGKLISKAAYIVALLVVVGRISIYFINTEFEWLPFLTYILQTFMIAVSLIVVAVPEGLPMAVTLSLAYSMRSMLKANNLVRKLHACETMGSTTVICTDKTGTLTQNRMQVFKIDTFGNPLDKIILEGFAVNSTAQLDLSGDKPKVLGNPTEGALLLWLHDKGVDYLKLRRENEIIGQLPFSTENKYMATVVRNSNDDKILYVKGAPEIIYTLCSDKAGVSQSELGTLLGDYQKMAKRTLGFACRKISDEEVVLRDGRPITEGLTFLGIAAISDPVREDVPQAVEKVQKAGIKIKIVTGDTPGTAVEIGREIGLWDDAHDNNKEIITGPEFAALTDKEVFDRVEGLKIIARARPLDKKRLVESLQAHNEVVAVTGDGTNDAPALKAAHIGLSMGDGTSVAKEASDITIINNSFASIGKAVMWGRSLYKNIQRFILFQLTVNVVACLIVLFGAFMGMESPLSVTQMLWVNLIMDTFAAIALASLPPSESVMSESPRPRSEFIITGSMWKFIFGISGIFVIILLLFLYYLQHTNLTSMLEIGKIPIHESTGLSPYELSLFFTTFVFLQFWNLFNAKAFASGQSAFHFRRCRGFILIVCMIISGQIFIVEFGGRFFNVTPLHLSDWLIIIFFTSPVLWIGEFVRKLSKK